MIASSFCAILAAAATVVASFSAADKPVPTPLDRGFKLLYDLDFAGGQQEFAGWQQQKPEDPVGYAAEAAGCLFGEFNRLGVLESQFFLDDDNFTEKKEMKPDAAQRVRFDKALQRSDELAKTALLREPRSRDALFALALTAGLRADYAGLIEKRNLASLGHGKDSSRWSEKLLAAHPNCYDGYLASGVSKYIVGCLIAPLRWMLQLGGFSADKKKGIQELQLTADRGRYLSPFARILLAVAWAREKDLPRARELLVGLQREFPNNKLFTREIARLDAGKL